MPLEASPLRLTQSSTEAVSGALFFAIKGTRVDGHQKVPEAVASGALGAVVESPETFAACHRGILVRSTREALGQAASRWHGEPSHHMKVVGITGTNGKTTLTYLLRGIWKALGWKTGIVGTVQTLIGEEVEPSPLTTPDALTLQSVLARMCDADVEAVAMEVSSIALDQKRVAGTQFEVAVFTCLTQDHLDYHETMERYFEAKRRLFADCNPKKTVFNVDDPTGQRLAAEFTALRPCTYSLQESGADFVVLSREFSALGIQAEIGTPLGPLSLTTPLLGEHNLSNCLGALATVYQMGGDLQVAVASLAENVGAPGRLERVSTPGPHVFVDYAHTEDALRNVLTSVRNIRGSEPGKIFTVFGCGGDRDRSKRPKMGKVASELSDVVIVTSDNPRSEDPAGIIQEIIQGIPPGSTFTSEIDRRRGIERALESAVEGDFIVVAGKGHETYQIQGDTKHPFDDRQIVRDYFA